jgi:DNA-binding transcriptional ArsR family regulator
LVFLLKTNSYLIFSIVSKIDTILVMFESNGTLHDLVGPARGRLLHALRAGPDEGVHLRELARGAGLSLSSVQRELERLTLLGVLDRRSVGNRVLLKLKRRDAFAKLLLAASVALELRGHIFEGMPKDRDAEKLLVDLCAHMPPDATLWCEYGAREFLAGVAVMLSGHTGYDRDVYLALAESLQAGSSVPWQYEHWYQKYHPDFARLLAMIDRERRTHVRSEA